MDVNILVPWLKAIFFALCFLLGGLLVFLWELEEIKDILKELTK